MSDGPKAIETRFDDYRFRSRLEARWAVFFNKLGIRYEYEKEGFDLGGGLWYLPDFWLSDLQCWVEIKGQEPTEQEHEKAYRLQQHTGHCVYLFAGQITVPSDELTHHRGRMPPAAFAYPLSQPATADHYWTECPGCRVVYINRSGSSFDCGSCDWMWELQQLLQDHIRAIPDEPLFEHHSYWMNKISDERSYADLFHTYNSPRLRAAYRAARQARFEGPYQQQI